MMPMIRTLIVAAALAYVVPAIGAEGSAADSSRFVTTSLRVSGAVEHPLNLGVDALRNFPARQVAEVPLICQSGANVGKLEQLRGVRLQDILDKAVIEAPDHNDVKKMVIIASASDGYKVIFSWSEVFNSPIGEGVIVFFEKDGMPLADEEGRIALVSTRDTRTGPRHVKWLREIEVRKIVE